MTAMSVDGNEQALDGLTFGPLPDGIGTPSDFTSENDGVALHQRIWESETPEGATQDLAVAVMRGDALSEPQAFHDWLVAYQGRPAEEASYEETSVQGRPGWLGTDQVFWLHEPGRGVAIRVDATRIDAGCLTELAESAKNGSAGQV